MEKRVVVTGIGAITPIGLDVDSTWASMKAGKHGFSLIDAFDPTEYKAKIAAQIRGFDPKDYMEKREFSRMDRYSQLAMVAAEEAVQDAGITDGSVDPERLGVVVGSGVGGISTTENETLTLDKKGPKRVNMLTVPKMIVNMAAGNIAIKYNAQGCCLNIVTACSTGTDCLGEAYRQIKYGMLDMVIGGGAEAAITKLSISSFIQLTALSDSQDPDSASIPFDKRRSGFVMGEGAGILVFEELEHAKARGAHIYCEVTGYASTCDAYHMTAPDPDGKGIMRAMRMAMEQSGVDTVDYINAHGTGTPYNDKTETTAIKSTFGEGAYHIPVSSTKSMTGHMLGAAGAVEAIACIKTIEEGFIPPTVGYQEKDEECDLDYVPNEGRKVDVRTALSNTMGFGGHNSTIAMARYEE